MERTVISVARDSERGTHAFPNRRLDNPPEDMFGELAQWGEQEFPDLSDGKRIDDVGMMRYRPDGEIISIDRI
jgi:hypothetical protein